MANPSARAQEVPTFQQTFKGIWERATAYTLEVAEAMPEDLYHYRPTETVLTFQEQILHVVDNIYSLHDRYVAELPLTYQEPTDTLSKAATIEILQKAFDHIAQSIAQREDKDLQQPAKDFWGNDHAIRSDIFFLIRDHMTHHRAQMILYLRMNNITPPRYRGW